MPLPDGGSPSIRLLGPADASVLENVAVGVFDNAIDPRWTAEFLADARHHLAVALIDDQVVGIASGVHHVHPDKPPELWVNEVAVGRLTRARESAGGPSRLCSNMAARWAAGRRGLRLNHRITRPDCFTRRSAATSRPSRL